MPLTNRRLLVFCLLLSLCSVNLLPVFDCPSDWIEYDFHCYKFVFHPKRSYIGARELCKENGAEVLSVDSVAEHTFVRGWLLDFDMERNSWYTSGAVSLEEDNFLNFENFDTQLSGNIQWSTYSDDNHQGLHIIYEYSEGQYSWAKGDGSKMMSYICEIPKNEVYRVIQNTRDFTYGTDFPDEESAPRGPTFYLLPSDTEILGSTSEVYLECAATGLPQPTYQWTVTRDNGQAQSLEGPRYTVTNGRVSIDNPQVTMDGGEYQCMAQNKFGIILTPPVVLAFADLGEFSNVDTAPVRPAEYQGTSIQCPKISSTSSLAISYNWIKDQTKPVNSQLTPYVFISGDGQLYFSEVTRGDNGVYYCMATLTNPTNRDNYMGSFQSPSRISTGIPLEVLGSPSGILSVQIPDSFVQVFPRQPVVGSDVKLECFAYGSGPLLYQWNVPSVRDQSTRFKYMDNNRVLTIAGVTLQDTGVYTCICSSRRSGSRDQKDFHLNIESKPMFSVELSDQHADKGSELTWRCQAYGIPQPTYTWYRNGQLLPSTGEMTITGNVLVIHILKEDQEGMYQCMAKNTHGVSTSGGQLRVLSIPPTFKKHPLQSTTLGSLGGSLTILCHPEAAPHPNITWLYNGEIIPHPLKGTPSHLQPLTSGHLRIVNLSYTDEGGYTCKAVNIHGSAQSFTQLTVLDRTLIVERPLDSTVVVNRTAVLLCRASYSSSLDLVYTWSFNDQKIDFHQDTHFKMRSPYTGDLYVVAAQLSHAGVYKCMATTQLDSASSSAALHVLGPPGEPVGVHVIKGQDSVDPYGLQLAWQDGATNGRPIQAYVISAKSNHSDSKWSVIMNAPISSVMVKDTLRLVSIKHLNPGSSYQFRVLAINQFGEGSPSTTSDEYPIPGAAPFKAPRNIRRWKGKVGTLHIIWEPLPPEDRNGWGIGYIVEWRLPRQDIRTENAWEKKILPDNRSEFVTTIAGTDQYYIQYEVRVTAYNMFGVGRPSPVQYIHSADDIPVAVPGLVWVEAYNSTALTVHWDKVPDNRESMKGRLRGYKVNYWRRYGEDENQAIQASFSGQADHALVIGLLPDTWYYVTVQVYNDAGNGQKSEKYPQKTFRRAPHMYPTEVYVHSYSSDSVKVTFRGVSTEVEEEPLRGYKIRVWEMSDNVRQAYDIDVGRTVQGIVTGIKKHSVYKLRVLGYSRGGDGTMSSPPTFFTLGGYIFFDSTSTIVLPASSCGGNIFSFLVTLQAVLPGMIIAVVLRLMT
ncbi:contactin-like [Saccostrea echinata]|uniref:contactin-like n=1 Tax=Saccostrea echinata TaxID=191078 RepID=UPI002A8062A9|nr:contactin-like [Saccostrea echinata]